LPLIPKTLKCAQIAVRIVIEVIDRRPPSGPHHRKPRTTASTGTGHAGRTFFPVQQRGWAIRCWCVKDAVAGILPRPETYW